jgi:SAM-dependent methyltransferase
MEWYDNDEMWEMMAPRLFDQKIRDKAPEEIDQIETLLDLKPGLKVLDLCCGVGRHSLELAKRGYSVTGVDRTAKYLEEIRSRAENQGLDVDLVQSDMREFCRPNSFDVAINIFTSFGYFEDPDDDRRVVDNLFESLKPGGKLVVEMIGKEIIARIFEPRDWQRWDDGTIILEERKVTKDWSWMENTWTVIREDFRREFSISHRAYSAAELSSLLRESGFAHVEVFGHLSGIPYDQDAKRLVAVAQKGS